MLLLQPGTDVLLRVWHAGLARVSGCGYCAHDCVQGGPGQMQWMQRYIVHEWGL